MSRGFHMGGAGGSGLDPFVAYTRSFDASGVVESFTVPAKGIYELEVWGCSGGGNTGLGGYSKGYALFEKDEVVYVACGNRSGFNGGGNVGSASTGYTKYAGGGATHFAKVTGQISAIGKTDFVDNWKGLIVAGGGGGATGFRGGHGGGLYGGNGQTNTGDFGTAASQSAGGTSGYGNGSFGQGGYNNNGSGGGGGLYGGAAGGYSISAGGGSGYIDGVPAITYDGVTYSPSTQQAVWNDLGKAKITRVA